MGARFRSNDKEPKTDRIHEALALLNKAAQEKQQELYDAVGERYGNIKQIFCECGEQGRKAAQHVRERADEVIHRGEEGIKHAKDGVKARVKDVDSKAREKPWLFVGGTAIISFLAGAWAYRRKKSREQGPPRKP